MVSNYSILNIHTLSFNYEVIGHKYYKKYYSTISLNFFIYILVVNNIHWILGIIIIIYLFII